MKFVFAFAMAVGFTLPAFAGTLKIVKATWGTAEVTAKAGEFCNDKQQCTYKISQKFVGDIGDNAQKPFALAWTCGEKAAKGAIKIERKTVPAPAEDQVVELNCPIPPLVPLTPAQRAAMFGTRKSMFRQMLMTPAGASLAADISAACAAEINKITKAGGSLRSQAIEKAIVPLASMHYPSGVQDNLFYHWTSSEGLMDLFGLRKMTPAESYANAKAKNLFDSMFDFIRNRPAPYASFWSRLFYVAEDPESSKSFGTMLIEFKLNPQGRLLPYSAEVRQAALDEISQRYPSIPQNCGMTMHNEMHAQFNDLVTIIMEDSGVEIIDYNEGGKWFQVTSPAIFRGVRLVK